MTETLRTRLGFLTDLRQAPGDTELALIYADFLADNGEEVEAQCIRNIVAKQQIPWWAARELEDNQFSWVQEYRHPDTYLCFAITYNRSLDDWLNDGPVILARNPVMYIDFPNSNPLFGWPWRQVGSCGWVDQGYKKKLTPQSCEVPTDIFLYLRIENEEENIFNGRSYIWDRKYDAFSSEETQQKAIKNCRKGLSNAAIRYAEDRLASLFQ